MDKREKLSGYENIVTGDRTGVPSPDAAVTIPGASAPEIRSLLGLAVAAVVVGALYFAQDVLIPITLSVMLSFVLAPLVNMMQRLGLWRAPSVVLAVLIAVGVLAAVGTMIGTQAANLTADAPRYAQTIERKVAGVQAFAAARMAAVSKEFAPRSRPAARGPAPASGSVSAPSIVTVSTTGASGDRRPVLVQVVQEQPSPLTVARTILQPILGPLETTVIVLIVAIFVLLQKEDLRDRFIRLFGSHDLHRTTIAMDEAGQRLSRYFASQLAVNTGFGIIVGGGLALIGVPSAAMWGILAGLLRFVPYIGSFLAAVAPIALAAAIDPGWGTAIAVALLFVIVEPLVGYVVEPYLYGHSTGLSPVSVIVAAVFWTWIWGPIGLILSTPLTLCLVVMGRHVKSLEFFDVMLGDRPALSAVDSFYQRILADNPDEALAQAELLLTDRTLERYYDDVVLPGLRLAGIDHARGTIDRARADRMTDAMLALVGDLQDHRDGPSSGAVIPTEAAPPGIVACVTGRGPFDEAAAAMLTQLLGRRGIATRRVTHAAVSRAAIGTLDLSGVAVVALCHLDLAGTPAHLRYLVRRVRQRAPDARIVVGLWAAGDPVPDDAEAARQVGGDDHVATFAAAVAGCEEALRVREPVLEPVS
ncbi:AI-2E family transporter [Sphingomonas montana]|uniref:AI-2E family transporter n=1 Tax=Sphingomonas montana TaxID=1843236 RepID=UPI0009F95349|nr:AI-2E family transporter [Sphingomonas montana]